MPDDENEKFLPPGMDPYDSFYSDPDMFFNFNQMNHLQVDVPDFKHRGQFNGSYPLDAQVVRTQIIENLQQVFDPEIPINIYDLGLVYKVDVQDNGAVHIVMTLTTPNCPSAQELPEVARMAATSVPGISVAQLDLTFDPPWDPSVMTEDAKMIMSIEYGMDVDQMPGTNR